VVDYCTMLTIHKILYCYYKLHYYNAHLYLHLQIDIAVEVG
jgi:hypothetical protein